MNGADTRPPTDETLRFRCGGRRTCTAHRQRTVSSRKECRVTLGPVRQRLLLRVKLVICRQIEARVIRLSLLELLPSARNVSPSGCAATQPTRHIINCRRVSFSDSPATWRLERNVDIDRGHALAPDFVELPRQLIRLGRHLERKWFAIGRLASRRRRDRRSRTSRAAPCARGL